MGNDHSSNIHPHENDRCLICWDELLPGTAAKCFRCNIYMHAHCEKQWRGDKGYCKCPHCSQVGLIGTISVHKND
jgi:hypothetical protein